MHIHRTINLLMVAASIVCTVSAKTADFVVVVNDSMVRVNDDSAIFRGLYSGSFEYIDIVKKFNSRGFSVDDRYDYTSRQRILTLIDCNYDSCQIVKAIVETPTLTTFIYENAGDSICYVETLSKDIYRIAEGSFANPEWHAGLFDIGMTEKEICGHLRLDIPKIKRLVVVKTNDTKVNNLARKKELIPLCTEYKIVNGRISKIVMRDTISADISELLHTIK